MRRLADSNLPTYCVDKSRHGNHGMSKARRVQRGDRHITTNVSIKLVAAAAGLWGGKCGCCTRASDNERSLALCSYEEHGYDKNDLLHDDAQRRSARSSAGLSGSTKNTTLGWTDGLSMGLIPDDCGAPEAGEGTTPRETPGCIGAGSLPWPSWHTVTSRPVRPLGVRHRHTRARSEPLTSQSPHSEGLGR